MSETQLFLSFGQTLGIKYRTHVIPILINDVALPNFTKCGGIGHKLNEV